MPAAYGLTNLVSVVAIVFANKMAMSSCGFSFPVALTWLHTSFTASGMVAMAAAGLFTPKVLPLRKSLPMASVYVGFIVCNNLSIRHNPGGGAHHRRAERVHREGAIGSGRGRALALALQAPAHAPTSL